MLVTFVELTAADCQGAAANLRCSLVLPRSSRALGGGVMHLPALGIKLCQGRVLQAGILLQPLPGGEGSFRSTSDKHLKKSNKEMMLRSWIFVQHLDCT